MKNKISTKMHRVIFLLASLFSNLYPATESAKILGIFPVQCRSHQSIHQAIIDGLAAKGHEITVITHFKSNNSKPNYKEISFDNNEGIDFRDSINIEDAVHFVGVEQMIRDGPIVDLSPFEKVLHLEYIKQLISSKENSIDLIIAEICATQCFHLLAHKLNVPLILVSPIITQPKIDHFVGNSYNPSFVPFPWSKFTTNMNFFQRFMNTFYYTLIHWYQNYNPNKNLERYARDVIKIELPSNEELNKRTALGLYNNHFSFLARPMPPNAINIAGIHIKEPKKLPKDVENFIKESDRGVIFFSFGSAIKASSISPEKLEIFKRVFSVIPQRVLWRVDDLNITDLPSNVKLGKWFPQRDILEHENVIGFISHCGLFGTLEAIHTATPVIGMPFAFDQFQNINLLVEKGAGIHVDYYTMDEKTLHDAINEVATNFKCQKNMQKLSKVFRDRPLSPLSEALYWIEYVLKHKGAPHLRTEAADMPLYQYMLLDVIFFILAAVIGVIYVCKFLFKIIICQLLPRQRSEKNKIH